MSTLCVDVDVRKKFETISDKFPANQLKDLEQDFCTCFDFMPSEDYEAACRQARREEMKAKAYKDVMMAFLKYITFLVEDTNVMASSQLVVTAYEETFQSAIERFEQLECELDKLALPSNDYD
ncbi:MAG: hypothetical protein AAGA75_22535 [Cyanobacteria bacterium P01_E01_bin.6]